MLTADLVDGRLHEQSLQCNPKRMVPALVASILYQKLQWADFLTIWPAATKPFSESLKTLITSYPCLSLNNTYLFISKHALNYAQYNKGLLSIIVRKIHQKCFKINLIFFSIKADHFYIKVDLFWSKLDLLKI